MISIQERSYGLDVALFNEFTLADFKQFEEALLKRASQLKRPHVLLDLSALKDFTLDMALEEMHFVRAHNEDFGRVAVVADDVWIKIAAHVAGRLSPGHTQYFRDVAQAQAWLME